MDDWDVFYYDDNIDAVCSLTTYHAENLSIGPLVEAHPDVIYFYAKLEPYKDWDFNEYTLPHHCSCHVNGDPCGICKDLNCVMTTQEKPSRPEGDDPRAGHEIPPLM